MIPTCPDCKSSFVPCDCYPIKLPEAKVVLEGDKIPTKGHAVLSNSTDGLCGELRNVLPEPIVDMFAEYWCEPERCGRDENLGQFIQMVAQYAVDNHKN